MAGDGIIEWILETGRQHPEGRPPDLEMRILERMIQEGVARCDADRDAPIEPPSAADRFAGTRGLPEISAADLDAEAIAAGLLHHGGLLVRGLYGAAQVERLRRAVELQEATPREQRAPSGATLNTLFELLRVYEESGLLRAVRGYLGSGPVLLPHRTKLRMRRANQQKQGGLPWHQDVNFFGRKSYAVNCWAAVSPCGDEAPGLAVIPTRTEQRLGWREEDGIAPLDYGAAVRIEEIDALRAGRPAAEPVMQPGDALLFDEMTVHRTNHRPWVADLQLVTVTWFFRPAGFPPKSRFPLAI